jgi:hypothetical protein
MVAENYENIIKETDAAYYIDFGDDIKCWLPKSQVELDRVSKTVEIPEWLHKQNFPQ